MEILKILISFIFFTYTIYCVIREIFSIDNIAIILEKPKKDSEEKLKLAEDKKKVKLSILGYLLIFHFVFIFWFYNQKGFIEGLSVEKLDQDFTMFLLILTLLATSITRFFRKTRTGEEFLLNYKKELKRSITFTFSNDTAFDIIIKKFIRDHKRKGIEVEIISDSSLDLEPLKHLKAGETFTFSPKTWLEKVTDIVEHNYYYHNKGIVVFNMHEHLKLAESLTAIDYILEIYLKMKNQEELVKIVVQIGDTYVIPKGVKHAVILANIGKLGLKWS